MLAMMVWETAHGGENITWLLWVALGFFGLMVLVGWLSSRQNNASQAKDESGHQPSHDEHME